MLKQPFIYIELCKIFQKYLVLIILVLLLSEFMFMDKIVNCIHYYCIQWCKNQHT